MDGIDAKASLFHRDGQQLVFRLLEQGIDAHDRAQLKLLIEANGGHVLAPGFTPRTGIILGAPNSQEWDTLHRSRPPTDTRIYGHYAWPNVCVRARQLVPVFNREPLFLKRDGSPLKVHLHARVNGRLELERLVRAHAGITDVSLEDADVAIVATTNPGRAGIRARAKAIASPAWIHKCVRQQRFDPEYLGLEPHERARDLSPVPSARDVSPPQLDEQDILELLPRKHNRQRCEFSTQDDANLARFLADNLFEFPGLRGNQVYRYLVDNNEDWAFRHTAHSWRERYVRNQARFNAAIARIVKANRADLADEDERRDFEQVLVMRNNKADNRRPKDGRERRRRVLGQRHGNHGLKDDEGEEFDLDEVEELEEEEDDDVLQRSMATPQRRLSRRERAGGPHSQVRSRSASPRRRSRPHAGSSRKDKSRAPAPPEEEEVVEEEEFEDEFADEDVAHEDADAAGEFEGYDDAGVGVPAAPPGEDMDDVMQWVNQLNAASYDDPGHTFDAGADVGGGDDAEAEDGQILAQVDDALPGGADTGAGSDVDVTMADTELPVPEATSTPIAQRHLSPDSPAVAGPGPSTLAARFKANQQPAPLAIVDGPARRTRARSKSVEPQGLQSAAVTRPSAPELSRMDSLAEVEAELAPDVVPAGGFSNNAAQRKGEDDTEGSSYSGAGRRTGSSDDEDTRLFLMHQQALANANVRRGLSHVLPRPSTSILPPPPSVDSNRLSMSRFRIPPLPLVPSSSDSASVSSSGTFKPSPGTRAGQLLAAKQEKWRPVPGTRAAELVESVRKSGGRRHVADVDDEEDEGAEPTPGGEDIDAHDADADEDSDEDQHEDVEPQPLPEAPPTRRSTRATVAASALPVAEASRPARAVRQRRF